MNDRWQYKIVEIPYRMFSAKQSERAQEQLDRHGQMGWELVSTVQTTSFEPIRLFMKKRA